MNATHETGNYIENNLPMKAIYFMYYAFTFLIPANVKRSVLPRNHFCSIAFFIPLDLSTVKLIKDTRNNVLK